MKQLKDYLYYHEDNPSLDIYCGDCLEIMPLLPKVDLVVTDPPYGINLETAYRLRGRRRLAQCKDYEEVHGDDKDFDPSPFLCYPQVVLFGANYFASKLPKASGWICWDKRENQAQNDQADGELAWTNFIKGVRICHHMWNGFLRDSERGESYHPTQKPVHLIKWIFSLRWTSPTATLVDPFMGSGSNGPTRTFKEKGIPDMDKGKEFEDLEEQRDLTIVMNNLVESGLSGYAAVIQKAITKAVAYAVKKEREACAQVVENISLKYTDDITGRAGEMARCIRERTNQ